MAKVIILDYNLGNMFSVKQACLKVGINAEVSSSKEDLKNASAIILPGVGAFPEAMKNINEIGVVDALIAEVNDGKPLFGICLGMQMLFSSSEEFNHTKGLNLVEGSVKKFQNEVEGERVKVPQINWNQINGENYNETPLSDVPSLEYMYFVHSYYVDASNKSDVLTTTSYGGIEYCSTVHKDNIFATQYHPEKSGEIGLKIYRKWAEINGLV